jgi:phosphinothricin acetyltransferase
MIRAATVGDAAAIAEIWNHYIRETLTTFTTAEKSEASIAAMIVEKEALGHGTFVVLDEGRVEGFATYGQFRAGPGYVRTMEHSVMLRPGIAGRGLGRALMTALENHAHSGGAHSIFAGVSAANETGRVFHARCGYVEIGRLPEVGFKWGRWIDLVLMQKMLS